MKKQIIFEDFIQDRAVQMFKQQDKDLKKQEYTVFIQVFTTDNLPFSPVNDDHKKISFKSENVNTDTVTMISVAGNTYNSVTQKYEVTDHTFVVGKVTNGNITEKVAIRRMKKFAESVINELNKQVKDPHLHEPHLLTDVQRVEQLLTDRNVQITKLSRETGIPAFTLYNYRKNPETLKKASHTNIQHLIVKYYETYFNRNEIERFRFMLIKMTNAYLKECKDNPILYNPVYELYMMCEHGDWHRLAKMEEIWKANYTADNRL